MADQLDRLTRALADHYVVERELKAGGMAIVYLAHDRRYDRSVAVKVLRPELAAALGPERFLREIRITAKLHHPHILPLLDSGEADGFLYYVMPLVEGESLRERLDREKQLPVEEATRIARQVADALDAAHRHDIIHRDIKPDNILLEGRHALVADFGIARALEFAGGEKLTDTGMAIGTPDYMSPEQAGAETDLDPRADVYSLGCVLYEMLVGEPPYTGPTARAIIARSIVDPVPSVRRTRDTIAPALDAAIAKAMAKVPADRFATAAQFAEAISTTVPAAAPPRSSGRRVVVIAAAGIVLAVIALTVGWDRFSALIGRASTAVVSERALTLVAEVDGSAAEDIRSAARGLVSAAIDQSGILRTLPASQIQLGMALAGMPDTARLELRTARELAFRGSIRTVVAPTIDHIGGTYAITVRVVDADSGTVVAVARGSANGADKLVPALDDVVHRLRRDLGERQASIQATRPLRVAITPSLEAYRLFDQGEKTFRSGDIAGALPAWREALQYDPDFASAMERIGMAYSNLGYPDSALLWRTRASTLPDRMTPGRRLTNEASLAAYGGDPSTALSIRERVVREFRTGHGNFAVALTSEGRYEEALTVLQAGAAADPFGSSAATLFNRAQWSLPLGRFDDARRLADDLTGDLGGLARLQVENAAAQWAVAESLAVSFLLRIDVQPRWAYARALVILASAHAARGRIQEAIETLDRATEYYVRQGVDPSGRNPRQARLILAGALDGGMEVAGLPPLASGTSVREQRLAALWAAWAGDTVPAATYLRSADGRQETPARGITPEHAQRLLLRARVAAAAGRWAEVIRLLQPIAASTFVRGDDPPFSQLARWTIADAYERIDGLDSAAVHFGLIAAYQGFGDIDQQYRGFVHSFAHRRLAMVHTKLGQFDRAEEHWVTFLDSFTDPDAGVRWMVREARAAPAQQGRGR